MPDQLQLRGGTTTEHNSFTGAAREVTVDTTKKTLVVHDGSQAGGTPLMKESGATAASSVQIGTGGVERFKITSSEVVFNETSTDTDFRIEGNGDANLFKVDAGNDRIGIGTSSPDNLLHLFESSTTQTANTESQLVLEKNSNSGITILSGFTSNGRILFGDSGDNDIGQIDYDHNNNNLSFTVNASERMRIDSSGNVGIGTSSPSTLLHLNKTSGDCDLQVQATGTNTDARLNLYGHSGGVSQIRFGDQDDTNVGLLTYDHPTNSMQFRTTDAERMRIDSSGNVGIGTVSPDGKLSVTGDIVCNSGTVRSNDGFVSDADLIFNADANANSSNSIIFKESNSEKMRIDSGGRLLHGVTTNTPVCSTAGAQAQVHNNNSVLGLAVAAYGNNSGGAILALGHSRGSVGDATGAVVNGDQLGDIRFGGSDGTDMVTTACAIRGEVDGSVSSNTIPGRLVFSINGTQQMRITSAGQFRAGDECTSDRTSYRHQLSSTAGSGDVLSLQNPSNTDGQGIGLGFWARNTNNAAIEVAKLKAVADETQANNTQKGSLRFLTNVGGSMGERMRITDAGEVLIGTTSTSNAATGFKVFDSGKQLAILRGDSSTHLFLNKLSGSSGTVATFAIATATKGSISVDSTSTAFNTSSDYRLKKNITLLSDGISRIKQLLPKKFNFIADETNTLVDGFLAHEVSSVVPQAVTGTKDAVDEDGNIDPQQLDYSKIVPLLVAAVQELIGKVEVLEAA